MDFQKQIYNRSNYMTEVACQADFMNGKHISNEQQFYV